MIRNCLTRCTQHCRTVVNKRNLSISHHQRSSASNVNIFDRVAKQLQKDRAFQRWFEFIWNNCHWKLRNIVFFYVTPNFEFNFLFNFPLILQWRCRCVRLYQSGGWRTNGGSHVWFDQRMQSYGWNRMWPWIYHATRITRRHRTLLSVWLQWGGPETGRSCFKTRRI